MYRYGLETLIEVQKNYPDTTLTVVVQEWAIYDRLWKEKYFMLYIIRTVKMEPPIPSKQVFWHWNMWNLRIL